ncbi:diadenylate cyclase CdaA [Clostridium kluyveri]|uniref:Diadenylate cyclase n=1 Tax=Clostridium kluyveri TaxID=1534 RepID=A0A1L5F3M0_CLOKL|nr:diadenylate cyclase CdaA [Clostridium kluyveri]APM37605.1 TIGR00159 family protein [Clostridium kluyveri]UZQ52436.1 diadenylate cyclase CdaA [Clostridium kluyveri]
MELLQLTVNSVKNISITSIMDILVVAYILYKVYMLIKETRAEQLLKGIMLIIFLIPISSFFNLVMLNWILTKTLTIGVLSIVIIFQPEIRRALEHLGRTAFNDKHILADEEIMEKVVTEIVTSVESLSQSKTGAIIVIEQVTGLGDVINTGTKLDAVVSSSLLENIFVVNTPLHDGATIIRNDRIVSAGCFLPLTNNNQLNKKLGTRHRAAIGISENSDALVIVVSEETGIISFVANGKLMRNYTKDRLKKVLTAIMKKRFQSKATWREKVIEWKEKLKKIKF